MSATADGAGRPAQLSLHALTGLPEVRAGDDLGALVGDALQRCALTPGDHDVLCVSHKIVSKAEGRVRDLRDVQVGVSARELASDTGKDPRVVQVILDESLEILRQREGLIIARHRSGAVMANAGIDQSNLGGDEEQVICLPLDADASASALRDALGRRFERAPAVVICDSVGRAWRRGVVGQAMGAAGLPALRDLRGDTDRQGRELRVTFTGYADQIASAAELLMGEAAEGLPVVLLRGLRWHEPALAASALVRTPEEDLFT
jgi:coenzyme F420-0:L-glutamate ligase/coenzyme F420-1:gamma-L-glutamate ligase